MFWNYFSLGLDAEAAYGFHTLRETHSWAASTRLANQAWYSWYSCTSGWFCGAQVRRVPLGCPGVRQTRQFLPGLIISRPACMLCASGVVTAAVLAGPGPAGALCASES